MEKEERYTDKSFGQISISRGQCSGKQHFYGSDLPQYNYITLQISQSEIIRGLSNDHHYSGHTPLIKVRMTANQFSEMITSLNIREGTCCTIEEVNSERIPFSHQESRKEFMHRKFEERMKEFAGTIREKQQAAKVLVKKKNLSKDDVHNLSHLLDWLTTEVEKNIPYFATCFQENMDEMVLEAKTEIESAIQNKIMKAGLSSLLENEPSVKKLERTKKSK